MKRHSHNPISWLLASSLLVGSAAWAAQPVAITNAGFEDPPLADGGLSSLGTVPGWSAFNSGAIRVLNPSSSADLTAEAPEGQNVGLVTSSTNQDGFSQTLSSSFQADAAYALTVKVANTKFTAGFPGYRVQLLANGTLLAEDDNSQTIAFDTVGTSTVNYSYNVGLHAGVVGQPLEIRLLSKGLSSGQELAFDDVQLTVALANPVANPGGPYLVAIPDGSLSLDGSGSLPSDGATITAWEWDLNINDNGGAFNADVTGATPTAIAYATLTTTYGMVEGVNTIKLRVTDDSSPAKTSIAQAIVTLAVPPATLTWDHNANGTASDGNGTWLNANQWLDGATPATWDNAAPNNAIIGSGGAGGTITLGAVTAGTVLLDNFTGTYVLNGGSLDQSGGITIGANAGHVNIHTEVKGTGGIIINRPSRVNLRGGGNNSFSGDLVISGGGEALDDDFVNIGTGNLHLNGGAYVNYWADTLTRTLGTGPGQVQLPGGTSGFSGQGANGMTVRLNNNANYEVVWGSTHFNPSTLVLQTPWANTNGKVTWQNLIDLNGTHRTIAVNKDHANGGGFFNDGFAQISGTIRNSDTENPAGLIKEGPGRLIFTVANTYDGGTTVNGGSVDYTTPAAIPPTGNVAFNDGTELWVRIGGANQFTADSSGAGSLGGLLSGINFTGAVDLVLRPASNPNYLGSIPTGITDLWIFGGNMTLSGTGAYTGATIIGQRGGGAITVSLGSATALPSGTPVTVDSSGTSRLDLNGFHATIGRFTAGSNNGGQKGTITDSVGGGVLTLTNGIFVDGHNNGGGEINVGTVDLNGATQTFAINNNTTTTKLFVGSNIRNGGVIINGGGNVSQTVFSGNSTYTGGTTVDRGILTINGSLADSTMLIKPATTVNGTGTLGFNVSGATIDQVVMTGGTLTATGLTVNVSGSLTQPEYVIVDATGGGTISGTFAGLTGAPGYALDYGTANQVKLVGSGTTSPYDNWATGGELFDGDANGDGVSNGLAFLLGASGPNVNALGLLPTVTETAGGLVLNFNMLNAAARGTAALALDHSNTLATGSWTTVSVPDTSSTVADVVFTVTGTNPLNVTATIPVSKAAGGKLFGRLVATE